MRTEQVKYFLETVKTGSFTRAAENLHIQQPSLREAIINLENELGGTLFHRSKRGVELNEFGRYCLPYFQLIHESYEKIKYYDVALQPPTIVYIDVQSNFDTFLAPFYTTVKPQLRGNDVTINTNNDLNSIANKLMQNKIDLAFICVPADEVNSTFFQTVLEHGLETSELISFETMVLLREQHPLASKKAITYHDLCEYPLLMNSYSSPTVTFLQRKVKICSNNMIRVGSWKLLENYLKSTDALTITAKGANDSDELVTRPLKQSITMVMQALYKKGNMNENILRCINVMKLTASNYI